MLTYTMFLRFYISIFFLLGRPPDFATAVIFDDNDATESENSLDLVDSADWASRAAHQDPVSQNNDQTNPLLLLRRNSSPESENVFDESDPYRQSEEGRNSHENPAPFNRMVTRDQSTLPKTTRAFWNRKKKKEIQNRTAKLETEFLGVYDLALLNTDLTKLDTETLKKVCTISSHDQQYYTARNPKFEKKRVRFFTSKRRKMTANLLYCPNMGAYIRESATNPSQCVYIFRRPLFRTRLWLRDQKCVNLTTEVTAPKPEEAAPTTPE